MPDITLYHYDNRNIFTHTSQQDDSLPFPDRSTNIANGSDNFFTGAGWISKDANTAPVVEPLGQDYAYAITHHAFGERVGDTLEIAIEGAAREQTVEGDTIRVWRRKMERAQFIDLKNQAVKRGLSAMVEVKIMTQEKMDSILTDPVQIHERFNPAHEQVKFGRSFI